MKVKFFVDAKAAILAGKTKSGVQEIEVTDQFVASLSDECRVELANNLYAEFGSPIGNWKGERVSTGEYSEATLANLALNLSERVRIRTLNDIQKNADRKREIDLVLAKPVDFFIRESDLRKKEFKYCVDGVIRLEWNDVPQLSAKVDARIEEIKSEIVEKLNRIDPSTEPDVPEIVDGYLISSNWIETNALIELNPEWFKKRDEAIKSRIENEKREEDEKEKQKAKNLKIASFEFLKLNGTENQIARFEANLLPENEFWDLVRSKEFEKLDKFDRYKLLKSSDINHNDECYQSEATFESETASELTSDEFDFFNKIKSLGFNVVARLHTGTCECGESVSRTGFLVNIDWHGRRLSREYQL